MISGAVSTTDVSGPRELPRGPHKLTREQVADNQRGRLLDAIVQAVGEKGYVATTVADVIGLAGVSRKAFYVHFLNREECFLAACDMIIDAEAKEISSVVRRSSSGRGLKVEPAITLLFKQALANPPLVRIALVELGALGMEGSALRERRMLTHEQLLRPSLGLSLSRTADPGPLLRGLVGGLNQVLYERVMRRRRPKLDGLIPSMAAWILSYREAPSAIFARAGEPPLASAALTTGGRAPGTLSPVCPTSKRRGLRGETTVPRGFVIHSQRERVLDAVANLTAARGYAAVTVREIAEHAAVSLDAFYEHFEGKEDAFMVAYELGHSRALAITETAYHSATTWTQSVHAAIAALFDFLAAEPAFARLALMEALVATSRTAMRARKGVAGFMSILTPHAEHLGEDAGAQDLALEAVRGGLAELCLTYATSARPQAIRDVVAPATYFALAPFVGSEEAERVAGEAQPGGRGLDT